MCIAASVVRGHTIWVYLLAGLKTELSNACRLCTPMLCRYTSIQGFFEHTSTCATAVANLRAPALQQVANMGAQGWIADINKAVAALVHLREGAPPIHVLGLAACFLISQARPKLVLSWMHSVRFHALRLIGFALPCAAANTLQGRSLQTAPDAATCKKFRDLLAREVNSAGMQVRRHPSCRRLYR